MADSADRHPPTPVRGYASRPEHEVVSASDAADSGPSVLYLLSLLLKWRYVLVGSTFGTAFVVVLLALLTFEPTFTSRASFIPQGPQRSVTGRIEAMAGQLGINVAGGDAGSESPQFYMELIHSREILEQLLADTFTASIDGTLRSGTLLDVLEIDASNEPLAVEAGLKWLGGSVSSSVSGETALVRLAVRTPSSSLSQDIAERLLRLLNDFNLRTRQSQATAEREFIETRLIAAQEELNAAEDQLKNFLQGNRQFENSPELQFDHDRLQRQVAIRQSVLASLTESYEQSRIAQVRNTPLITIVERPREAAVRNPRGLLRRGFMGLVLGLTLGLGIVFGREAIERSHASGGAGYLALRRRWREAAGDVRRLVGGTRRQPTNARRLPSRTDE